ncbi:hypothetical protein HII31_00485 [Pseudocercospora fuligena]|uniref:Uncharacterized protein n=1 Tax=Pseudocercospora fuligena TaxID=685502 RepID=A0A8H6RVB2_9PEZI|nr:hypothetical protein HII31_00485 [Pseudocercospora fuligena]
MPTWAQVAASPPPRIDARLPNKTGFLHLAQELQDQILENALTKDREVDTCLGQDIWWSRCAIAEEKGSSTIHNLMFVSSKIREDALAVYIKKNKFMFDLDWSPLRPDDPKICCPCPVLLRHVTRLRMRPPVGYMAFDLSYTDGKWSIEPRGAYAARERLLKCLMDVPRERSCKGIGEKALRALHKEVRQIEDEYYAEARLRCPGYWSVT